MLKPGPVDSLMSYLCYSGAIYTSLGLGGICLKGHIRFVTGMEALNGFLLIIWKALFTFFPNGAVLTMG